MRKDNGFTLIELMVALSVAAILLTLAVPSMTEFVRKNRRAAAVNSLVSDIQRARSSAASSGVTAVLCHSLNGTGCSGQSSPDWSSGWLLFFDSNNNASLDAAETPIAVHEALEGVRMPSNTGTFSFRANFTSSIGGSVAVCVDGSDNRGIIVSNTGRPRLVDMEPPGISCP